MKSIFKKTSFLLILTVLTGGILRFWQLGSFPVSLNWDEVSHGYNAYSILKTGQDEWGKSFPIIFRAFGDFKLPLYIYLSTLPVLIFGLNSFAVRFVSALAGTLAILGIYYLYSALFPNQPKKNGLLPAFLLAICPWHFFISRPALEADLALTLIIFGAVFLIKGLNSSKYFLFSALSFGLSLHTYNTARVFVPLFLLAAFIIYRKKIKLDKFFILSAILLAFFSSIVLFQIFSGEGTARYGQLKILSESAVFQIGEKRANSSLPPLAARLIHNRPVYFAKTFASNYLNYFTPQFFGQTKGAQTQFAIPNRNLFGVVVILFAVIGFLVSGKALIISWLLLSPVAAALTADPPQALRPNPMIPALLILSTIGVYYVRSKISKRLSEVFLMVFMVLVTVSFALFHKDYFSTYQKTYSQSWQYGYSQVFDYLSKNKMEGKNIFITKRYGEAHIFYAFYSKLDPKAMQPGQNNIRFEKSDWFWTDKIGEVYFINDWLIPTTVIYSLPLESGGDVPAIGSILVTSPDHVPSNAKILKTINFLDGSPAFIITEVL